MDFRAASERLKDCVTDADIAREAGVAVQSIRAARLDPLSTNYRKPPSGWRAAIARIARRRATALQRLAADVDPDSAAPGDRG